MRESFKRDGFESNGATLAEVARAVFDAAPEVRECVIIQDGTLRFEIYSDIAMTEDEQRWVLLNRMQNCTLAYTTMDNVPDEVAKPVRQRGRKGSGLTQGQRAKLRRLVDQGKIIHRWGDPWDLSEDDLALLGDVK